MKKLYLFDVCWTIVNLNSTYEYINFLIDKWIKKYYKIFFFKRYIWIVYYILEKIFRKDFKRNLAVRFLKWLKEDNLIKINKEFYKYYKKYINLNIIETLLDKNKYNDTYLLSASINPPIDFLKKDLNINGFSSVLWINNWKYNWKLDFDLLGKKENIFKEKLIEINLYDEIHFFTDNTEDISIINYFIKNNKKIYAHIVIYNNKYYWKKYFKNNNIKHEFIY